LSSKTHLEIVMVRPGSTEADRWRSHQVG
jgi:hypothetical protein